NLEVLESRAPIPVFSFEVKNSHAPLGAKQMASDDEAVACVVALPGKYKNLCLSTRLRALLKNDLRCRAAPVLHERAGFERVLLVRDPVQLSHLAAGCDSQGCLHRVKEPRSQKPSHVQRAQARLAPPGKRWSGRCYIPRPKAFPRNP